MTDLEQLFRDAAALAEEGHPPPGEPLARLAGARVAHRRRRWAALAIPAAAATVAAAVILPMTLRGDSSASRHSSLAAGGETPTNTTAPSTSAATTCTYRPAPQQAGGARVGIPPAEPSGLPTEATIQTNRGTITIALMPSARCTVNSLAHLAIAKFYDNTPCHRLTTQSIYVLQCGDPTGAGYGGPGYTYDDEHLANSTYPAGTVAMANAGPGNNGSQFFLVYADSQLAPNYTVFGHITNGLDVLRTIAAAGARPANDGAPNLAVKILSLTVR